MKEIIDKLKDLNRETGGLYSINITSNGSIYLKNYNNTILITDSVQELRENMYKEILKL